jgi:hypothetical protein
MMPRLRPRTTPFGEGRHACGGGLILAPEQVNILFRLLERRRGRASPIITANPQHPAGNDMFDNKALVDALVDRLRQRCIPIRIDGPSLREAAPDAGPPPANPASPSSAARRAAMPSRKPARSPPQRRAHIGRQHAGRSRRGPRLETVRADPGSSRAVATTCPATLG